MSYIALYRKYRPKNFEQVIGQKHIIKTLKNQVETNRISHSYLFCGTRGTGKTSTAKIFAKLLNCKEPINNIPCEKCSMCVAFNENRSLNIAEIDAASNNSVDDIREIREEVKYPPTDGKYRIYIIDEVHMLSIGAFNALLKTLEEPPSYVIFILATTDPHKIPVTILSRCQRFDFKRISNVDMVENIKNYMLNENVSIDEDALYYIAKISDGAMRDALSILDQCISFYYGENITLNKVLELVGAVDDNIFFRFIDAIVNFSEVEIISIIEEIIESGRDISQFVSDLINHIRNLLISSISTNEDNNLDISKEKMEKLRNQASNIDRQYLIKLIEEFSKIQANLKYAFDERIVLEAGCIKLCSVVSEEDITDIRQKINFLEKKLEEKNIQTVYIEKENLESKKIEELKPRELAIPEDIKVAIENYKMVVNKFKEPEKAFLQQAIPKSLEDDFLYLVCPNALVNRLESMKDSIQEALFELFNKDYNIKPISIQKYDIAYKKVIANESKKENFNNINDMIKLFPNSILNIE